MDGSLTISNALLLAIVAAIGGALTMGGRMFIAALRKNGNGKHPPAALGEADLRRVLEEIAVSRFHDLRNLLHTANTAAQLYYQSTETMKLQLAEIARLAGEIKLQLEAVRVRMERFPR